MSAHMLLAVLLLSNATGKTTVRVSPGTMVPVSGYSGPLIADDVATVAHVTWNGTALVDTRGAPWVMNGTVPQVARSGRTPAGAGAFSDANYYAPPTAADLMDLSTGNFSACFVLAPSAADLTTPFAVPFSNGVYNSSGYFWQWTTGGAAVALGSTTTAAATVTTASAGVVSVFCMGRSGTSLLAKLNLGPIVSVTPAAWVTGVSEPATLGRYNAATGRAMTGTMYEAWWSTTPASDALFTAIMQRVKLRAQITAW